MPHLHRGDVLLSRYTITRKLGEGGFGKVYAAMDGHRSYAIKISKSGHLSTEQRVYEELGFDDYGNRIIGVPRLYRSGSVHGNDFLVLEMLGTSLHDKARALGGRFSLKTCLMIAAQAISRIEHIHSKGYLHRDIKPDNMLTGRGSLQRRIYVVDFGLAKSFREWRGRHVREREDGMAGTVTFSSINVMRGVRASRRDDLESLAYSLVDMWKGRLPWSRIGGDGRERWRRVLRKKQRVVWEEECHGFPGLYWFIKYVRELQFADRPSYSYCKECFTEAIRDLGLVDDGRFDWVR